jgi:hypothetical protein
MIYKEGNPGAKLKTKNKKITAEFKALHFFSQNCNGRFGKLSEDQWQIHSLRILQKSSAFESYRSITTCRLRFLASIFVTVAFKVTQNVHQKRLVVLLISEA